jgi:signal peptidase II
MDAVMTESTGSKLKWLWLAVLVIAIDLGTKAIATAMLTYGNPVPVLPSFNLTLLHNTGAAFSFLADAAGWQRWFFVTLAVVVSVVLHGYVVDFLHFYWQDWHFPAFNLADTAITIGAAMMILDAFRKPADDSGDANRSN